MLSKKHGGLGILEISTHNKALLMKFVHKFLNKENIPWVKIIWNPTTLKQPLVTELWIHFGGEI